MKEVIQMYRQKREQTYFTVTGLYSYDPTLFNNLNLPVSLDKDSAITEILMTCGLLEIAYPDGAILKKIINIWSFARKPDWQRMIDALYGEYNPLHNYDRTEDSTGSGTNTGQRGIQQSGQFAESEHIDDVNTRTIDTTETRTDNLTDTRTDNLTDTRTPNITNERTDNLTEQKNGGETTTHQNTAYNAGLTDTSKDILVRNGDSTTNTGTQTTTETGKEATTHTGTQTTAHTGTQTNKTEGTITDDRDIDRNKSGSNSSSETVNEMGTQSNTGHLYARGNIGVTSTQNLIEQEIEIRYKFNIYEIIAREFKEKFCNLTYIL